MTAEWIAALSTAATFLVIAASAAAALVQLRHLRVSNQIAAINEVMNVLQSPDFAETLRFLRAELPALLQDPEVRRALVGPSWLHDVPEEYRRLSVVANYFEVLGSLVKNAIIDTRIVCELWSSIIVDLWEAFGPVVMQRRVVLEMPVLWENFEYLAVVSEAWMVRHPTGNYPRGTRRWSFPTWAETIER